jgi:hypothetical protein
MWRSSYAGMIRRILKVQPDKKDGKVAKVLRIGEKYGLMQRVFLNPL